MRRKREGGREEVEEEEGRRGWALGKPSCRVRIVAATHMYFRHITEPQRPI